MDYGLLLWLLLPFAVELISSSKTHAEVDSSQRVVDRDNNKTVSIKMKKRNYLKSQYAKKDCVL